MFQARHRLVRPLRRLRPWADLLSLAGALVLFFNWVWTTNVAVERSSASAALRAAEQERRLFEQFTFLAQDIRQVSASVAGLERDLLYFERDILSNFPSDAHQRESDTLYRNYKLRGVGIASKAISAEQIDMAVRHCWHNADQSRVDSLPSRLDDQLHRVCMAMQDLRTEKDKLLDAAWKTQGGKPKTSEDDAKIEEKVRAITGDRYRALLDRFSSLFESFHHISKSRSNELTQRLERATQATATAQTVGNLLYVFGTVLVLLGRFFKDAVSADPPSARPRGPRLAKKQRQCLLRKQKTTR